MWSENARSKAEHEIGQTRSASAHDAAETSTLKSRVSSLEAANRDTLAVLDSKSTAYDKLAEELSSQQEKAQLLRRRVSELEQNLQSAYSAASSTRFREQSLQQELELLKRNNEWFETELKTKNADHLKFRKDKSSRITELQQLNEQYISEVESLKRSDAVLRGRLDEQIQKFEDSLTTIQELREEAVQAADAFRVELDSAGRLAELQKTSADTAKQRAQELSIALEEAKEEAADEIGRIRAEVETEHNDKVAAEQRISELETTIEQLQSELELVKAQSSTPRRVNGHGTMTPVRPGTPTGVFSPSSASRGKSNISMTQMFTEYKKVERELASEKRHAEQLSKSLEEMVENLEKTQPEIDELRADHGRLQGEMVEISTLRDAAIKERDTAVRELRRAQGQVEQLRKERDVFQQQVRDESSQIKILLMEQHLREKGQQLSEEEMNDLQRAAVGDEGGLAAMSDTGRVISENLTVFRNIVELQEQNVKIQAMLRQLGERMETSEAHEKDPLRQQEHDELEALRVKVSTYKDELQNMVIQSKSYIKERDMFRNMLVRRGQLPAQVEPGAFAQSMPLPAAGSPPQGMAGSLQGSVVGEVSDYAKLLKDLQHHFDSYRQEAATDNRALKNQLNEVSKRNSQLQIDLSKQMSQVSATNQRAEMLQANYQMLKAENVELQKRSETIRENATRQEFRTQQAAEELVEVKGLIESMHRETANLKAEKDLWKSIEKRLIEDNESLRNERGRLENLNSTVQNLLNEREQSDSESHRRMQRQIELLESDLQTTKRKLHDEVEEGKKTTLRREYEHEQSQKRIDDLMASLSSIREESIQAKTTRDLLQARVDEMDIELRSAEERLQLIQTKPVAAGTGSVTANEEDSLTREQELSIEVYELKRDLELKNTELERFNEQVETYKRISQASEERLQEMSDTNDQYREETERTLEEKDRIIKDLEQRVEDISTELITTNNELTRLRDEQGISERKLDEQKATFETELARLRDQNDEHRARAEALLQDVKSQAGIANQYQQNYEDELLKHAEAAKALQTIRSESNQLRLEMVKLRTEAESAITSLKQKEESWSEQVARYKSELDELRNRREEVLHQNALLHGQFEEVTKQISSLRRDRSSLPENEPDTTSSLGLESLQEVIKYLRREKEIVDVQYHMSTQAANRLQQQLDHTQSQLDETRLSLDQQLRANADTERNVLNHNKLIETLNELNLYRESSVTLRAETKRATSALAEKSKRVEDLLTEITPLQTRIAELENLAELREGEMKLLQEDRDHWQARTQNILAKYDRVDPAELETLKQRLSTLETERDEAVTARDALQIQVEMIPQQVESAKQDLRARLSEQFKARNKDLTGRINQKQTELDTANSQKAELETELAFTREQLQSLQDQPAAPQVNGVQLQSSTETTQTPQPEQTPIPLKEYTASISELEAKIAAKDQEIERLEVERESVFKAREAELKAVLNKRLAEVKADLQSASSRMIKELEKNLQARQKELEALKTDKQGSQEASAANGPIPPPGNTTEPQPSTTGKELPSLTEEQIRVLVKENETVRGILRTNIRKAVDKEKEALRRDLELAPKAGSQPISTGMPEELEKKCEAEKEALIKELDGKFESEKQAIVKAQEERCASEKQALLNQQEEKIASEKQTTIIKLQEKFAVEKLAFSKESERKIEDQVALVEKRNAVKVNLAQSQARNAMAKFQVVTKAAEETPEKPVAEVWAVAKDAKAPPVGAASSKSATPASTPSNPAAGANQNGQSEGKAPPETVSQPLIPSTNSTQAEPEAAAKLESTSTAENQAEQGSTTPKSAQSKHAGTGPAVLRSLHSNLPRGNRGGRGGQQMAQHSQNASTSEAQQQPQQAASRGSGIPRGGFRGRGQGRGGAQSMQTNAPQGASQAQADGSPRGGLNPQARQFNPHGNKRSREDGPGDDQGGKRIRGGGAGT
jgi:nucleoprotein TPR